MNLELEQYWLEILLAYGISLTFLAALIIVSWADSRRTAGRLNEIEQAPDDS